MVNLPGNVFQHHTPDNHNQITYLTYYGYVPLSPLSLQEGAVFSPSPSALSWGKGVSVIYTQFPLKAYIDSHQSGYWLVNNLSILQHLQNLCSHTLDDRLALDSHRHRLH